MFKRFARSLIKPLLQRPSHIALKAFATEQTIPPYQKHCKIFKDEPEKYTSNLSLERPLEEAKTFRVIDLQGTLLANNPKIEKSLLLKIYEVMVKTDSMDNILYMAQRQGKISFYMPSLGEVASTVASVAALKDQDLIFPQYREQGSLLWRGFTITQCTNQCFGNHLDLGKGRQMPVHYGSKELNYVTVSSPLTTQVPQASGAGYAFKMRNEDRIAVSFFGEGAASEGDFHAALNFAVTLNSQTLFLCRNNHYAISTPTVDQFRGDGIAGKGKGYGILSLRVDGNDALAVYESIKEAREYIIKNKAPVLIELMTYRVGDHSTSDHSVLYREEEELKSWITNNNPITRFGKYLEKYHNREFNGKEDEELRKRFREETIQALKNAIVEPFAPIDDLFTDVYDEMTTNLKEQHNELVEHLKKYGEHYNLKKYKN